VDDKIFIREMGETMKFFPDLYIEENELLDGVITSARLLGYGVEIKDYPHWRILSFIMKGDRVVRLKFYKSLSLLDVHHFKGRIITDISGGISADVVEHSLASGFKAKIRDVVKWL